MACRPLEINVMFTLDINVMSADDLKSVNRFSKMKPYVVVSLGGDPRTKRRTRIDEGGGNNPRWNDRISFPIEAAALNNLYLVFDIKSKRTLGDRDVGRVTVPLKKLFDAADAQRAVEYQVRRPSGDPRGTLRFSYKFGAYPAHVGASTAYPPPYGYAPPVVQAQPPPPRRTRPVLAVLLLVSDMISCASEMVGASDYDADFDF